MTEKIFSVIVPSAGTGSRFDKNLPKQYHKLNDLTVIETTINELLKSSNVDKIIIAVSESDNLISKQNFIDNPNVMIIKGGLTRAQSVLNALNEPCLDSAKYIVVHDAARPNFSYKDIDIMLSQLIDKNLDGIFPFIPLSDSLRSKSKGTMDKKDFFLVQTPQICKKVALKDSLISCAEASIEAPDESFALERSGFLVDKIIGNRGNIKITYKEDIQLISKFNTRSGTGFDVHRLEDGKGIVLGGHFIPCEFSIIAHSDGDVLLHSIADSILGAAALGDIGKFFSDSDVANKDIDSKEIIDFCISKINELGLEIYNIDTTIICEYPKINPHRENILESLSNILGVNENKIGLKATTVEKLGIIGKNKAISVQTIANLKQQ